MFNQKKIIRGGIALLLVGVILAARQFLFSAPQKQAQDEVFVVGLKQDESQIVEKLKTQGLIRSKLSFDLILYLIGKHNGIQPGGYTVSQNLSAWNLAKKMTDAPDMKWVVIPEGFRKEQIGELLAKTFGWSDEELDAWNTTYTKTRIDYIEGTYFPDTYLIPVKESGLDIAKRMTRRFDEQFAPFIKQFSDQNIQWTTGLKLASIVQREAAGKDDMSLIAGILWNRLKSGMNLEIDATVQYARGKTDAGWWAPVTADDIKNIDSPYNTYIYKGLPPHPISNPSIMAIEAVLHPIETECLYYLHDSSKNIHCATTFEEHQANVEQYLKK